MAQNISVNEARPELRRVYLELNLRSDPTFPADAETGQAKVSVNGAAPTPTGVGALVPVYPAAGLYYVELAQSVVAARRVGDLLSVIYDSATAVPITVRVEVRAPEWLFEGTLTAGSTTGFTLPVGASTVNDAYRDKVLYVYAGAGVGQMEEVAAYNGTGRNGTFKNPLAVGLNATSQVLIFPATAASNPANMVIGAVQEVLDPVTVGTNNDKSDYFLADDQTFSTEGSVGTVVNPVVVGTNTDKTGYTLLGGSLTAEGVAQAVWSAANRALTEKGGFALDPAERASIVAAWLANPDVEATLATILAYHIEIDPVTGVMKVFAQDKVRELYSRSTQRSPLAAIVRIEA